MQGMRDCYYAHFLSKNNRIKSNLEKMHTTFSLFEITYRYMTNSTYIHVHVHDIHCMYIIYYKRTVVHVYYAAATIQT